jgi:hypothetical protein
MVAPRYALTERWASAGAIDCPGVHPFEGDLIAVKDAYRKERSAPIGG